MQLGHAIENYGGRLGGTIERSSDNRVDMHVAPF
jgi:hypothetical protein